MKYLQPTTTSEADLLGILGGMGPLASAEFLKTIYAYGLRGKCEQAAPRVVTYSDPTFPDRTQALLTGNYDVLLSKLIEALNYLHDLKVSKIVICCITCHYLLPQLPLNLRDRTICLIDTILSEVAVRKTTHLLLCTNGTRQLDIFPRSSLWGRAEPYILSPNKADQDAVHEMIYQVKANDISIRSACHFVEHLRKKYVVDSVIVGCTELHLLSRFADHGIFSQNGDGQRRSFLDPLTLLAQEFASVNSIDIESSNPEMVLEAQI